MKKNPFIEKFENKSNSELEVIIGNTKAYVEEARKAALGLLENRDGKHEVIIQAKKDFEELESKRDQTRIDKLRGIEETVQKLNSIKIGKEEKWILKNQRELEVLRLDESKFRVRIEDNYMSFAAPLMMCVLEQQSGYRTFPSIYWQSFLKWGLGGSVVFSLLVLIRFDGWDSYWFALIPMVFHLGMQLLTMPLIYRVILSEFKEQLEGN